MEEEFERLRREIRELIISSLKRKYVSTSSHMNYLTGNAYQSVTLDSEVVTGYRADRSEFFKIFDFTDKRVLDCGCNIGELSRLTRKQGADLVDGIEYDAYFAQIGRVINAYNATSHVSISQGDLTDPQVFKSNYDIALAFSVFPYILPNLKALASHVREALILETHNVTVNIKNTYILPVQRYFPYYTYLGTTDFGKGEGERAVFAFAKEYKSLLPGGAIDLRIDLAKSEFDYVAPMLAVIRQIAPTSPRTIKDIEMIVAGFTEPLNDRHLLTAGRTYWFEMMKGYLEYTGIGYVTPDNVYVTYLGEALEDLNFDINLKRTLSTKEALIQRVFARFHDIDKLLKGSREVAQVDPIKVIIGDDLHKGRYKVVHSNPNTRTGCNYIDGYHRVFWASALGTKYIPALFCYD